MAKRGAKGNANDNSNQLVYYILFFALGALFAAGILAVNDGISGNVVEDFSFDANRVAQAYADFRSVQQPGEGLDKTTVLMGAEAEAAVENFKSPAERQIYEHLVRRDIERVVSALSFKKQLQEEAGFEDVEMKSTAEGTWVVTSVTLGGEKRPAQQRDIEEFYINGPTEGTLTVHETVNHEGKPVAVEVFATGDLDGHSASTGDLDGHTASIGDLDGHSASTGDLDGHNA